MVAKQKCPHCERQVAVKDSGELYKHKCTHSDHAQQPQAEPAPESDEVEDDRLEDEQSQDAAIEQIRETLSEAGHVPKPTKNKVSMTFRHSVNLPADEVHIQADMDYLIGEVEKQGKQPASRVHEVKRETHGKWIHYTYSVDVR
jgi:hypothetical protein